MSPIESYLDIDVLASIGIIIGLLAICIVFWLYFRGQIEEKRYMKKLEQMEDRYKELKMNKPD